MDVTAEQTVAVSLGERSYDIVITSQGISSFPQHLEEWQGRKDHLKTSAKTALLVTDSHVKPLHADRLRAVLREQGWRTGLLDLDAGEKSKNLETISLIYDVLVEMKADRRTPLIAIGGGVIGDAAGFAAATYSRGIPLIQVPTSLLAQVDSSVGGKVGVNHPKGKNLIGAFHQPLGVFIDTDTLNTLPERDYRSGLAEVIKYGVILDAEFFTYLEENIVGLNQRDPSVMRKIIARSCELKAQVVEQDEYERSGLRACLNYGHTFAHAFEALAGYGELLHGEAVAIGMVYASRLAQRLGMVDAAMTDRQVKLLEAVSLPVDLGDLSWPAQKVLEYMKLDKKTVGGELRFVLPTRMGEVRTVPGISESEVLAVLESPQ